jgi:hypothetical protein
LTEIKASLSDFIYNFMEFEDWMKCRHDSLLVQGWLAAGMFAWIEADQAGPGE